MTSHDSRAGSDASAAHGWTHPYRRRPFGSAEVAELRGLLAVVPFRDAIHRDMNTAAAEVFGARLLAYNQNGVSQAELAKAVGFTRGYTAFLVACARRTGIAADLTKVKDRLEVGSDGQSRVVLRLSEYRKVPADLYAAVSAAIAASHEVVIRSS